MLSAIEVFRQNDGDVTKDYYAHMNARGSMGQLAVALFRAQKRSSAAKSYRHGRYRRAAYDVKNWSLAEVCRILKSFEHSMVWGWQRDPKTPVFDWVLYVELPTGQCSFHSAERLDGPDYQGVWDGVIGGSVTNILAFCKTVEGNN